MYCAYSFKFFLQASISAVPHTPPLRNVSPTVLLVFRIPLAMTCHYTLYSESFEAPSYMLVSLWRPTDSKISFRHASRIQYCNNIYYIFCELCSLQSAHTQHPHHT
jgi:hypothetical protein